MLCCEFREENLLIGFVPLFQWWACWSPSTSCKRRTGDSRSRLKPWPWRRKGCSSSVLSSQCLSPPPPQLSVTHTHTTQNSSSVIGLVCKIANRYDAFAFSRYLSPETTNRSSTLLSSKDVSFILSLIMSTTVTATYYYCQTSMELILSVSYKWTFISYHVNIHIWYYWILAIIWHLDLPIFWFTLLLQFYMHVLIFTLCSASLHTSVLYSKCVNDFLFWFLHFVWNCM